MFNPPTPAKVVILGGGIGSLSTAIRITDDPNWRQRFSSITLYQMGWRLGGKGASGRGDYGRIQEHGLHVWMGFYENAFRVIREIYQELGRPPGTPLATWTDAFKKHDFIELMEQYDNTWRKWPLDFEPNNDTPGSGLGIPTLWDHLIRVLEMLEVVISSSKYADTAPRAHSLKDEVLGLLREAGFELGTMEAELGAKLMGSAIHLAKTLEGPSATHDPKIHDAIGDILEEVIKWLKAHYGSVLDNDLARHLYVLVDFSVACIRGAIRAGLLQNNGDFDALDEYDTVDWLKSHGASAVTCDSGLVHGMYDLMLAYENGDPAKPSFGAGSFLHFAVRMTLTYRGSVFWKMQAGMGDTIMGPIYEVLKKRGVEFKFFHCVDQLIVSQDHDSIEEVHINIQATPKDGTYDPFVTVNDLKCWPATPNFDQLVQGDALRDQKINLESFWTPWKPVDTKPLKRGVDFDIVVLGIPVASHPYICGDLIAKNRRWADMVANLQTTRTLALQLWMEPDLAGLGWTDPSVIMDSYAQPFNTWADMSQLIVREDWPTPVKNIAYYCGPMIGGIPPQNDPTVPAREKEAVKQAAIDWLKKDVGYLWPKAVTPDGVLDWSLLTDPLNRTGQDRLDAQFWRANIDPSERYVLTVPKSTAHRMRTDNTTLDNLIVAGDWTWNPMNVGCVEGTVMSGIMAGNIMLGQPVDQGIVGYHRS